MAFSTSYGDSADYFGHADYEAAKKGGASDSQILSFLQSKPELLRGGNVAGGGGLFDQVQAAAKSEQRPSAPAQPAQPAVDYSAALDSYRRELESTRSSFEGKLNDYQRQFDSARSTYESTLKQRDADLEAAKSMAESYKADAARYQEANVQSQLQGLRSGDTATSNRGGASGGDLRSGGNANRVSSQGSLVDVRARVDATDSVLSRKGPVVETIQRRSAQRVNPGAGLERSRAAAAGGAAGHYASRFG